jgi:tRNA dimethylallyltransferase
LRALLDGLFPGPERSEDLRERLLARVSEQGAQYLHRVLRRMDPKAAAKIHANDVPKLIRAIEVSLSAKQPMTQQWERGRSAPQVGSVLIRTAAMSALTSEWRRCLTPG